MKRLMMVVVAALIATAAQAELILISEEQGSEGKITFLQLGDSTPRTYTVTNGDSQWTFTSSIGVCETLTFRKIDTTQGVSVSREGGYLIDRIPPLNPCCNWRTRLGIWSPDYDPSEWIEGHGGLPANPMQQQCTPIPMGNEAASFGKVKSMYRE